MPLTPAKELRNPIPPPTRKIVPNLNSGVSKVKIFNEYLSFKFNTDINTKKIKGDKLISRNVSRRDFIN